MSAPGSHNTSPGCGARPWLPGSGSRAAACRTPQEGGAGTKVVTCRYHRAAAVDGQYRSWECSFGDARPRGRPASARESRNCGMSLNGFSLESAHLPVSLGAIDLAGVCHGFISLATCRMLSLIHISEPTRLGM